MSPCRKCKAKCCRYFALEIDTPRTREDFEKVRWYIAHKDVTIFVENRKWFLNVNNECRYITRDHKCRIYDKRPLVCREHSHHECERDSGDFAFERIFNSLEELDNYVDRRFRRKK